MKPALATMIIVTAILALVAGSFAMINMGSGNHANCLAAIPGSPKCIGGMDPLQFAITHINAFLGVSLGIVGSLTALLLVSLVLLAWLAASDAATPAAASSYFSKIFAEEHARGIQKQLRWISLLEKRDPSPYRAMTA